MNIWTGLLFLDGSLADAGLARELADDRLANDQPAATSTPVTEPLARAREARAALDATPSRRASPGIALR
ncbi:MAG TPA: hypothetical protein VGQ93_14250 [Lysobacter sp.]|jgi:hypothetical protein|nr:hypothetical protein [Lysobacter sp.]